MTRAGVWIPSFAAFMATVLFLCTFSLITKENVHPFHASHIPLLALDIKPATEIPFHHMAITLKMSVNGLELSTQDGFKFLLPKDDLKWSEFLKSRSRAAVFHGMALMTPIAGASRVQLWPHQSVPGFEIRRIINSLSIHGFDTFDVAVRAQRRE